jgi:hypothetical protein
MSSETGPLLRELYLYRVGVFRKTNFGFNDDLVTAELVHPEVTRIEPETAWVFRRHRAALS